MPKDVMVLRRLINGKLYTSYHILDHANATRIRQDIIRNSLNAFPSEKEADEFASRS